jgi:hypothetical protein
MIFFCFVLLLEWDEFQRQTNHPLSTVGDQVKECCLIKWSPKIINKFYFINIIHFDFQSLIYLKWNVDVNLPGEGILNCHWIGQLSSPGCVLFQAFDVNKKNVLVSNN